MALSAYQTQGLVALAAALEQATHGNKESLYQKYCGDLGMSRPTLFRHMKSIAIRVPRQRRADAGKTTLLLDEARLISAYLMEGYRQNDNKITSLKEAVTVLRATGKIVAGRVDETTGEFFPLADSTIHTALRNYCLHPEQLRQATPHTRLGSRHPNAVWQVDASVCVLYYLPAGGAALVELDQAVHYKNKPENLKAIEQLRVIRYVLADHTSGLIRYRYYPHAESGEHTVRFLAWAMAKKDGNDPFHGAPFTVMVDPGATAGGLVKRFCARMGIKLIVNKSRNARAKGSVEKANHLVETTFEQALRYKQRPRSFDELNALAETYQLHWNFTAIHTRTQKSRFDGWLSITPEQLRETPRESQLLELASHEPIKRQVQPDLTIHFKNRIWDVKSVPNVFIKEWIKVHWHPFIDNTAMAVVFDDKGQEQHIALPEITVGEHGFRSDVAWIGEDYKAKPDTIVDTNRKLVHALAAGTTTLEATEKKRRSKNYIPFDGEINPTIVADTTVLPTFIPKRSTPLAVAAPNVEYLRKSPTASAIWLSKQLGAAWKPEMRVLIEQRYPNGATEDELYALLADIRAGNGGCELPRLAVVGG